MAETVTLRVKRRSAPDSRACWEEFRVRVPPTANVVAALKEIRKTPVNAAGRPTPPVVWDCSCLEGVCGACAMLINGKARLACTALLKDLAQPVRLEPLSKFPVVRDLMVDRTALFEGLKRAKAWIELDGTHDLGPGPRVQQSLQAWTYELSRCNSCGCCMEACPQVNGRSAFIGPAPLAQITRFNAHPLGESLRAERLEAARGPGGVHECGKAQNCEKVCPKRLPLVWAIAELNRQAVAYSIRQWLSR